MAIVVSIAGIFILIAAVVVTYAAFALVSAARASRRWPTVPGRIVGSDVRASRAFIRYQYATTGGEYEGTHLTLGGWPYPTPSTAAAQVRRYPVGTQVAVYYDPQHPTTMTVLEPGVSFDLLYLPAVAAALLLIALALLSWGLRHVV